MSTEPSGLLIAGDILISKESLKFGWDANLACKSDIRDIVLDLKVI